MAIFSGKDGKVLVGATPVADITRWQFATTAHNRSYASSATGGYKRRLPGVKSGAGDFEFRLDRDAPVTAQLAEGAQVTLKLHLDPTEQFSVPAVIDTLKLSVDVSSGDAVGGRAEFTADGAWTAPSFGS